MAKGKKRSRFEEIAKGPEIASDQGVENLPQTNNLPKYKSRFDSIAKTMHSAIQDSSIPTDLPGGITLSNEEITTFDKQINRANEEIARLKAGYNQYEAEQPNLLGEAVADAIQKAEKAGAAQPIEKIFQTGTRAAENLQKGNTGEGIADIVSTLLHTAGTPFTVPFGVGEKVSEKVVGKDATEMVGELLNLPFTATAKAREAVVGDLGDPYNELIDLIGGIVLTGGALKKAKSIKEPKLGKPKGMSVKQVDDVIRSKLRVEPQKAEIKGKQTAEPTIKGAEDIAKPKLNVEPPQFEALTDVLKKSDTHTVKAVSEATGITEKLIKEYFDYETKNKRFKKFKNEKGEDVYKLSDEYKTKIQEDDIKSKPSTGVKNEIKNNETNKIPTKQGQPIKGEGKTKTQKGAAQQKGKNKKEVGKPIPILSEPELKKIKTKTIKDVKEGFGLDSPKLGKFANKNLPTVNVLNKIKQLGLMDEAVKITRELGKDSDFDIVKGTTLEMVSRNMLKNIERLAVNKKKKVKIIEKETPKSPSEVFTETPIKEVPEYLRNIMIDAAKELKNELEIARIDRTGSYDNGRIKSTTENTFPEWFSILGRNRKDVLKALDKIIDSKVDEKGTLVEAVKTAIIDRLIGSHEEAVTIGTAGKFRKHVLGQIEANPDFLEFWNRLDKDLTKSELMKKFKEYEQEASFKPGIDFYKPPKVLSGERLSKAKIKPVKSLDEYRSFRAKFKDQKFTAEGLADELFNLVKEREKYRLAENSYIYRQTIDVAKKLSKMTGKDIIADPFNIWVDAKKIKSREDFNSRVFPKEIKEPEVKLTEEGRKRKERAEGIDKVETRQRMNVKLEVKKGEPVKASDIIKQGEDYLKIPIRIGKISLRNAIGIFKQKAEVVRLKEANDLATYSHEIAHYIDKKNRLRQTVLRRFSKELQDLDYDQTKRRNYEGFAEFMRHYLTRDDAKQIAPTVYKWFTEDFLPKDKEFQKFIEGQRDLIVKWREQGSLARAISVIDIGPGIGVRALKTEIVNMAKKLGGFAAKAPEEFVTAMINKLHPLNIVVNQIVKDNQVTLRPSRDPAKLASALEKASDSMAYAAIKNGWYDFALNKKSKGLEEIVAPVSSRKVTKNGFLPIQEALAYAVAKHGKTLWERNINPGISLTDINYILKNYKSKVYDNFAKDLTDFSNAGLDYLLESGVFSKEIVDKMREVNPFYIPLKRVIEQTSTLGRNIGYVDQGKPIKGYTRGGSGRDIINPLESIIQQTELFISAGNKARVARALVDLGNDFGGVGKYIEKVPAPKEVKAFSVERIAKQLEDLGADLTEVDLKEIVNVFGLGKSYFGRDNIVSIYRAGKQEFYQLHPKLFRAVKGLDRKSIGKAFDIIFGTPTRIQRLGATGLRPSFSLAMNPVRDIPTYVIQNQYGGSNWLKQMNPLKPFMGIIEAKFLGKTPARTKFEAIGGEMQGLIGIDRKFTQNAVNEILANDKLSKTYNVVRHPVNAFRDLMAFPEAGPRLAEAKSVMKKYEPKIKEAIDNGDLIEARKLKEDMRVDMANAANEVTVNFKRSGNWGEIINQAVPFFNPQIQGLVNMSKALKRDPIGVGMKAITGLTVPALSLWYLNKDEGWYQELPTWEKLAFLHFKMPDFVGKYKVAGLEVGAGDIVRVPLPFEWGYIFAGIPVAAADAYYKENINILKEAAWEAAANTTPDVFPALFKPGIEVKTNYDFFRERPVVSRTLEGLRPEMQFTDYTTETAKKIGQALGVSPQKVDHLITGYSGGLAFDIVKALDINKSEELSDVPIIGRFTSRSASMGINGKSVNEMYEARERANTLYRTINEEKKAGRKYEVKGKDLDYLKARDLMNKSAEKLKLLRDRLHQIEKLDLDVGLKRQIVEAVNHAAYIIARKSTYFLRSEKEKEFLNNLELPKIPKIPKENLK